MIYRIQAHLRWVSQPFEFSGLGHRGSGFRLGSVDLTRGSEPSTLNPRPRLKHSTRFRLESLFATELLQEQVGWGFL